VKKNGDESKAEHKHWINENLICFIINIAITGHTKEVFATIKTSTLKIQVSMAQNITKIYSIVNLLELKDIFMDRSQLN
jgi:hypothetical protein